MGISIAACPDAPVSVRWAVATIEYRTEVVHRPLELTGELDKSTGTDVVATRRSELKEFDQVKSLVRERVEGVEFLWIQQRQVLVAPNPVADRRRHSREL